MYVTCAEATKSRLTKPIEAAASVTLSAREIECLQCLYTSDYESHRRRNPDRVPGTCEWFLRHQKYENWRQEQSSSFLWVSADPGCGKSVLASFLVEELKSQESQAILPGNVYFFFFKSDNTEQSSAVYALCALLHQLLTTQNRLVRHAIPQFEQKGRRIAEEFDTLWSIFTTAANSKESHTSICVIDGLDECEELTRKKLMSSLVNFFSTRAEDHDQPFLKVLLTSRPYFQIVSTFHDLPEIRLKLEDEIDNTVEDIELMVKARVKGFASRRPYLEPGKITALENSLISEADRTFLWVALVLDLLDKSFEGSQEELDEILHKLPGDLEAVFEEILRRSPNPEKAKFILHIVVGATRPLTLSEMNIALAIRPGNESLEDLAPRMVPAISEYIKEACGLFVRLIESRVYLIHETARDFLVNSLENRNQTPERWKHSLVSVESNLALAIICITYLNFRVFESHPLVIDENQEFKEVGKEVARYTQKHHFLDYAAKNCAIHVRNSHEDKTLMKSWMDLCYTRSGRFNTWFQIFWMAESEHGYNPRWRTRLILGSYLGLHKMVQLKLKQGAAIDEQDKSGMTALQWAVKKTHANVVQLLLHEGADPNIMDNSGMTALHKAAKTGNETIVRLLLDHGAMVDAHDTVFDPSDDETGCTPLHIAAQNGHHSVVQLLIEHGADIRASDSQGNTALHHAVWSHDTKILQLLLDHGAELEDTNMEGHTVLYDAVRCDAMDWDCVNMSQFLLERGANAVTQDSSWQTPLHEAAFYGGDPLARLLLSRGSDVNAVDENGETVLMSSAKSGQSLMVPLLLEFGADINAMTERGTALHMAAWHSRTYIGTGPHSFKFETVAQTLLENGAIVDAKDEEGRTPLMCAAKGGSVEIMQLLLDRNANLDMQDENGDTALHWAAADGHEEAVRLLIHQGAKLDERDDKGKTALFWAVEGGFAAVVRLLLDGGSSRDVPDSDGDTALKVAEMNGFDEISSLLSVDLSPCA
jgi:ankyrin repeat domain-containing protein 50